MYSMVLMAALTASPDAPNFGYGHGGCCGGCTGTVVAVGCGGCSGGCYSSCYGGCHSIFPLFPRFRARLAGVFGCHSSCHGSCTGSCYGSCFGSCTGSCFGSCTGSCMGSCHGSCFGSGPVVNPINPATACYGSPLFYNSTGVFSGPTVYGYPIYSPTSFGYGSCFGSGPVYYGPDFHQGGHYAPPLNDSSILEGQSRRDVVVPTITIDNTKEFRGAEAKPAATPARLTVELPADAKLYVDGALITGDAAVRNFHTPALPPGRTFYYDLKAELVVGGETVTEEKRVLVKAGDALSQSFDKLIAAAKPATPAAVATR